MSTTDAPTHTFPAADGPRSDELRAEEVIARRRSKRSKRRGAPSSTAADDPGTGQWRRPLAVLQTLAAVCFIAGMAATPWEEEKTAASYHDALAGAPDQAQVAALLLWLTYALFAAAAFALIAILGVPRTWPYRIGALFVVLGATTLPGLLITDAYDLALAQGLPREQSAEISEAVEPMFLSTVLGIAGGMLGLLVGPTILWWVAWHRSLVPVAVPALVTLGWVIGFASFEVPVMIAGCATILAASGIAAASLWRDEPGARAATA